MQLKSWIAPLALFTSAVSALNQIEVSGSNFIDSVTKKRFEIIGVAYQPGGSAGFKPQTGTDPLSDGSTCLRDAILMQKLGINCIRVYNLDPAVSHDECASIFNAAGIYMIIDVNSPLPNQSIDAASPADSYNSVYLQRIFQVVEAFKNYSNLLGFFAGNEIINDLSSGKIDPPYIRAVTRDLKEYIKNHAPRPIPVGYSAADVRTILQDTFEYLTCSLSGDSDDMTRIDFFGLNSYSWCGNGNYVSSGYNTMVEGFAGTTIPIFFSEYGCNLVKPRTFTEVATIYGPEMRTDMSGGLVYEWTEETNMYGLVEINDNNTVTLLIDYLNLQKQLDQLDLSALEVANSSAANVKAPQCSSSLIKESGFDSSFNIPSTPSGGSSYISNGVTGAKGGQSLSVSNTAMPCEVYDDNGQKMSGLALKVVSTSNQPTDSSTGGSASSSSAAMPTLAPQAAVGLAAVGAMGMFLL